MMNLEINDYCLISLTAFEMKMFLVKDDKMSKVNRDLHLEKRAAKSKAKPYTLLHCFIIIT